MFIDPDFLNMGAGFTESAAVIAQRGALNFGSVQMNSGIFGGFADAESFHKVLAAAHGRHAEAIQQHHETLNRLTEKATLAARTFCDRDQAIATDVENARSMFDA